MSILFFRIALLFSILALTATAPFAADAKVTLTAKNMTSRLDGKERVNTFTDAKMTQGEAIFTAATMVSRGEKGMEALTGTGSARFADPVCTGTADTIIINTKTQVAQFSGQAKLVLITKPGEGKAPGRTMTITAENATYDYGKRQAQFPAGATIVLEGVKFTVTDLVTYDWTTGEVRVVKPAPAKEK